jgi:mercuric ion transport protein
VRTAPAPPAPLPKTNSVCQVKSWLVHVIAAFGVASCCGLPFILATLGLSTAWLGGLALLAAPHRLFLLIAAAICISGAAILLWRQRTLVCAPGAVCARPMVRRVTIAGLLLGLALLYIGYTYA